jgi:TolB protein
MKPKSDPSTFETGRDRTSRRPWLVLGGLAVVLLLVMLCLVAAAGVGGFLWLRSAQVATTEAPAQVAAPVAPAMQDAASAAAVNRIAFVDPAGRLGTVAPDGSERRVLSAPGATYRFPAWAPDSSRIAAVGIEENQGGVYVWADETGAPRASLYSSGNRPPIYLYWSPDSREVSFLANDRASLGLWLAAADAASPARQIASGQPFYWDWGQDSDQLFIHTGGLDADARLAFLDTGSQRTGENVARPGLFQAPGISAGGRYLAYAQADGDQFQVVVEDRRSGRRNAVPHLGLAALGWSPTEQRLAFTSPRIDQLTSAGPLRLLDGETGQVTTLVQDTVFAFFWSPDGRRIAYLTVESGGSSPGAGRPVGLASQPAQPSRLALRLWVVDVASGLQQPVLSFRPSPIFLSQFIPFFDQYALSHRLWSPASDALVLPMMDGSGNSAIHVVSVESGEAMRVADGTMAFWSWR